MQHTMQAEGFGVRLRPVQMEDASFIVWLRNLDHVKGRVGDSATDIASQRTWLETYFKREGDYYFIVETTGGIPVGTYGIYNVKGGTAETGRWIVRPGVPAAVASGILLFDLVFHRLSFREVRGSTVSTNRAVLSINRKFGFREVGVQTGAQMIGGKPADLVNFILTASDWARVRPSLVTLAQIAVSQIKDWENAERRRAVG